MLPTPCQMGNLSCLARRLHHNRPRGFFQLSTESLEIPRANFGSDDPPFDQPRIGRQSPDLIKEDRFESKRIHMIVANETCIVTSRVARVDFLRPVYEIFDRGVACSATVKSTAVPITPAPESGYPRMRWLSTFGLLEMRHCTSSNTSADTIVPR